MPAQKRQNQITSHRASCSFRMLLALLLLQVACVQSFTSCLSKASPSFPKTIKQLATATSSEDTTEKSQDEGEFKPSFYKTPYVTKRGRPIWKERKQLRDLQVGEKLEGFVVQELLDGKTGPKLYLEVGVGNYNPNRRRWTLANAMLRLGNRGTKESVTRKRAARLRSKTAIECYVSKIYPENGRLEVVLNPEQVPDGNEPAKIPVGSLEPGQVLAGRVHRVEPYGVLLDVGANRMGLLHIQKVADLYGCYIDGEEGLKEAGLERGAKIKIQVESVERKRLFLDFTQEVKEEAEKERLERQKEKEERKRRREEGAKSEASTAKTAAGAVASTGAVASASSAVASDSASLSSKDADELKNQEEAAWTAYAAQNDEDVGDDEDYDDDDDYDEDRDIEDALGVGSY